MPAKSIESMEWLGTKSWPVAWAQPAAAAPAQARHVKRCIASSHDPLTSRAAGTRHVHVSSSAHPRPQPGSLLEGCGLFWAWGLPGPQKPSSPTVTRWLGSRLFSQPAISSIQICKQAGGEASGSVWPCRWAGSGRCHGSSSAGAARWRPARHQQRCWAAWCWPVCPCLQVVGAGFGVLGAGIAFIQKVPRLVHLPCRGAKKCVGSGTGVLLIASFVADWRAGTRSAQPLAGGGGLPGSSQRWWGRPCGRQQLKTDG